MSSITLDDWLFFYLYAGCVAETKATAMDNVVNVWRPNTASRLQAPKLTAYRVKYLAARRRFPSAGPYSMGTGRRSVQPNTDAICWKSRTRDNRQQASRKSLEGLHIVQSGLYAARQNQPAYAGPEGRTFQVALWWRYWRAIAYHASIVLIAG